MATIQCGAQIFSGVEAIVFDKDGTLADSGEFLRGLAQRRSRLLDAKVPGVQEPLLMAFGVERDTLNPAGLMAVGTRRENEIAAAAYVAETGRDWIEAVNWVQEAFAEADRHLPRKADHTPPYADTPDVLLALSGAGLKLALLSADSTANVSDFVQRYELHPYFQVLLGTDGDLSKPDPALLRQVCDRLEVSPAATLVVGDSAADLQMARATGAAGAVAIARSPLSAACLAEATVVIEQLSQLQVVDS